MICYKVVTWKLRSTSPPNFYSLQYKLDEWVESKIGKIFVFSELGWAKAFTLKNGRVFKAEADVLEMPDFILGDVCEEGLERYWYYEKYRDVISPIGTLWANRVKLVEEV